MMSGFGACASTGIISFMLEGAGKAQKGLSRAIEYNLSVKPSYLEAQTGITGLSRFLNAHTFACSSCFWFMGQRPGTLQIVFKPTR
ncbi:Hypothetical protein HDN1F_15590 [gamma proteobacterium HdN1]|nr:Hypothetical protein HDN1F_15590 [gamma proteobacterium HdN1]